MKQAAYSGSRTAERISALVEKMTLESPTDSLGAITQHIPDKGVQMVRYYGGIPTKCAASVTGCCPSK